MSMTPTDSEWGRLDEAPAASAQMIQWYAPETYALIAGDEDDEVIEVEIDASTLGYIKSPRGKRRRWWSR